MREALRVYSAEKGYFGEVICATKVKSHAHSRKLAPLVDYDHELVYWVNWGIEKKNGKPRVAHFRHYPRSSSKGIKTEVNSQITSRYSGSLESSKHRKAKEAIYALLVEWMSNDLHLPWAFVDTEISDFPMSGDLLAGAEEIVKEYPLKTPFGPEYRLDIAILGKVVGKSRIVLAGIEIEYTHQFDFSKALICKTLGFPLVSINVEEVDEDEIGEEWARNILSETTATSADGLRRNYIYVHRFLSTVYLDIPRELVPEARHQYVVFTKSRDRLLSWLIKLRDVLNLDNVQVLISPVSDKNDQLHRQIENAGNLAGESWQDHDERGYLQITLDKPPTKAGNLYYFHFTLARLCNSELDCLVGYKYELGHVHSPGELLFWERFQVKGDGATRSKVAPKRLSEPVLQILAQLEKPASTEKHE